MARAAVPPSPEGKGLGVISLMIKWSLFFLLVGQGLTGCQYQFGRGELFQRNETISVPYAEGDQKGELTAEVIKNIATSGALRYVSSGGDLVLNIKLIEFREEHLDFRYDRKKQVNSNDRLSQLKPV